MSILVFGIVGLDLLTEEFQVASIIHLIGCYLTGQAPDLVNYPLSMPVFDTVGAQIVGIILLFFGCYMPSPFWAATCAVSFREALAEEEASRVLNLPSKAELRRDNESKTKQVQAFWKKLMPVPLSEAP